MGKHPRAVNRGPPLQPRQDSIFLRNYPSLPGSICTFRAEVFALFLLLAIINPVYAMPDNSVVGPYVPQFLPGEHFPQLRFQLPRIGIGAITGILLLLGGKLSGAIGAILPSFMGITSVLWVMMRCDPVVKPEWAWM